ncbi:Lrp/AsnC family transcriptional regulator [Cumulibacter manganitolerans]|uniref:Lrp/AsnC family transcriptional regulator n=1 Tax=Cumulibacter manganitolerans TaxID=1884992 RepID=UPI0012962DA0|nr:Lrp/AsnC family transcriptional regulator [Cumulibacter manganitolerans]
MPESEPKDAGRTGRTVDLDATDRRLIAALEADARISIRALAEKLRISRATAYDRIERLHARGVITGYTVTTDPDKLGVGLSAYIYLRITQQSWKSVREQVRVIPEVAHAALVSGEFDLILMVRVSDAVALRTLVLDRLQAIPEVQASQTVLVLDEMR